MLINLNTRMVDVWKAFSTDASHPFAYPSDNTCIFEEWYLKNFTEADCRERIYLPIFWTGFYIRAAFGKQQSAIDHLQGYLNILDRTKKYYTIVQYDDGILNNLTDLDIKVYSMSGQPMHYSLPLLCPPHNFSYSGKRDLFVSFVGRITHPVRQLIVEQFKPYVDCYISTERHDLDEYCEILARSEFVLCPRGYGPTSFRLVEALQYSAIPVYISDKIIYPHNLPFPGLDCQPDHNSIKDLYDVLKHVGPAFEKSRQHIPMYYEQYCTYEGVKSMILQNLLYEDNKHSRTQAN